MRIAPTIALLALTLSAAAQDTCPTSTARAHGQVLDATGAAILGATITLPTQTHPPHHRRGPLHHRLPPFRQVPRNHRG